jgi:hypothetical protein
MRDALGGRARRPPHRPVLEEVHLARVGEARGEQARELRERGPGVERGREHAARLGEQGGRPGRLLRGGARLALRPYNARVCRRLRTRRSTSALTNGLVTKSCAPSCSARCFAANVASAVRTRIGR